MISERINTFRPIAFCEPLFIEFSHSASECLRPAIISLISIQLAITRRAAARYLKRFGWHKSSFLFTRFKTMG